jgi:hypothetical protein
LLGYQSDSRIPENISRANWFLQKFCEARLFPVPRRLKPAALAPKHTTSGGIPGMAFGRLLPNRLTGKAAPEGIESQMLKSH